jgi:hypothetical protein
MIALLRKLIVPLLVLALLLGAVSVLLLLLLVVPAIDMMPTALAVTVVLVIALIAVWRMARTDRWFDEIEIDSSGRRV